MGEVCFVPTEAPCGVEPCFWLDGVNTNVCRGSRADESLPVGVKVDGGLLPDASPLKEKRGGLAPAAAAGALLKEKRGALFDGGLGKGMVEVSPGENFPNVNDAACPEGAADPKEKPMEDDVVFY